MAAKSNHYSNPKGDQDDRQINDPQDARTGPLDLRQCDLGGRHQPCDRLSDLDGPPPPHSSRINVGIALAILKFVPQGPATARARSKASISKRARLSSIRTCVSRAIVIIVSASAAKTRSLNSVRRRASNFALAGTCVRSEKHRKDFLDGFLYRGPQIRTTNLFGQVATRADVCANKSRTGGFRGGAASCDSGARNCPPVHRLCTAVCTDLCTSSSSSDFGSRKYNDFRGLLGKWLRR